MRPRARLVLLSFSMLFLELALIRWTGSNVIFLSYFSNFVLLGSFFGIGLGFLGGTQGRDWFAWTPAVLLLLVAFVRVFPVQIDRRGSQAIFFGAVQRTGLPTWITLPVVFIAVAAVMATVGAGVARSFREFEPLEAYRLDVLGSLAGIVAFSAFSFAGSPPVAWGAITAAVLAVLYGRKIRWPQVGALAAIVVLLGLESLTPSTTWSPYYRITMSRTRPGVIQIDVNGIPHQSIESTADRRGDTPIYFLPYERVRSLPKTVLVVGAGNGSDVAVALAEGADRVDAVEIDPKLYAIGHRLNSDHPYQSPRVHVAIGDGRAFLRQSTSRYDLILFALPDSLTLVAGQSSLRLESYLFTEQAFRAAKEHLAPDGVFAMYNYYRERWLVDRLANTLRVVFGHAPCVDSNSFNLAMLAVSVDPAAIRCPAPWAGPTTGAAVQPATDDHPFVYLESRSIPSFYLLSIGLILLAALAGVGAMGLRPRVVAGYVDLFFMGAAFLLLETKSVVQFALLFGTTWFVNALVFAGVLLVVLAAIEVARLVRVSRPELLYLALFAALAVAWAVPSATLLSLSLVPRFIAATSLAFAPIFLANLVFAERFKDVGSSTTAFGVNLLGAMVGGLLEYASLVIGYRDLALVVAALYGLAFIAGRRVGVGRAEVRA